MDFNGDLTFFTNEENRTLYDRFNKILRNNTIFFDVLVGYFRTSGFHALYQSMEEIEKIRILVGLNVDKKTIEYLHKSESGEYILSDGEIKENYKNSIKDEIEEVDDTKEVEEGIKKFIEFIQSGKLEMRIYTKAPIHAKVYILRKDMEKSDNFGSVVTGSSNFSRAGLLNNLEFNVELKDSRDVKFALQKFEELWKYGVEITDEYIETINTDTWIREDITPYEMYLKFLYEYFKEEINQDKRDDTLNLLPDGFMELEYQKDAVLNARRILKAYNGVFISDVVGLGKTYICAMLAKTLRDGKKLIICPPVLIKYWEDVILDFAVPSVRVESLGKLDSIIEDGSDKYKYIFIDEAHRFRNSDTENFSKLHKICFNKKVILISATPQNNYTTDIANQIYLFQQKNNSHIIPNEKNIEGFFNKLNNNLKKHKDNKEEYLRVLKENSEIIRDKVLRNIMIRRTRTEIVKYYGNDLEKQGLKFPKLDNPEQIIYEYDDETDKLFEETINVIKSLDYSRYKAILYLKLISPKLNSLIIGQKNMVGFMKSVLIKRLESSFYAFKKTLERFIISYERFIEMYNNGTVYISKKYNVYDMLDNGDTEKLLRLHEEEDVQIYKSAQFKDEFMEKLLSDLKMMKGLLLKWENVKYDPKIDSFIKNLKENKILKNQKIIIFTESMETAEYLNKNINNIFQNQSKFFTGQSSENLKNEIRKNFDQNIKEKDQKNDFRILVTTDVLAEGINLHRANIIINYDLPWNPTRVMQRVGRINRVGSKHSKIHIFNFFPTTKSNVHLSLKDNITAKIQAFHDTLGEDFKYLTDEEEVNSFGLSGKNKNYYEKMMDNDIYEEEENDKSELKYLQIIREIRDNNEALFTKIKKLPKKIRSGKQLDNLDKNSTMTFFRKGALKKFFINSGNEPVELPFFEIIEKVESKKDDIRVCVSDDFYTQLELNKKALNFALSDGEVKINESKSVGNEAKMKKILKAIKSYKKFTDIEEENIIKLQELWDNGVIPIGKTKEILKAIDKKMEPVEILNIILSLIPDDYFKFQNKDETIENIKLEVILSMYFKK